jgi:hypothetical protein
MDELTHISFIVEWFPTKHLGHRVVDGTVTSSCCLVSNDPSEREQHQINPTQNDSWLE